jgi:hypothetical protein
MFDKSIQPLANIVRPMLDDSKFAWAHLDRMFILRVVEETGLMQEIAPTFSHDNTKIQVYTIGRTPEFQDPDALNEWLSSGGRTSKVETWQIGKDVSRDQVTQHRDQQTGNLYVFYKIVNDKWTAQFISRKIFEQMKVAEESM